MKTKLKLHLLLLALLSLSGFAHAQGTAIGYQGRLNDNGSAATGLYDFTFAVFDAEAGGPALGPTLVQDAVPVTNGLFNVSLDFGPDIFTGPPRWLEITVRASGVGDPSILVPRTPLLPTAYSIFAGKAGGLVSGTVTADQLNSGGVSPTAGQFLSYDGGNFLWSDPAVWSVSGGHAYYNAGNVGIGTTTPAHRLSLAGGPTWTANQWQGAIDLPNAAAIGWGSNGAGKRFGMGHSGGGFYLFRTASDPGTTDYDALYDFVVNDDGNVGIGTTTPSGRLQVNGGWDGEQGALQLSGHRPTIRFTGDADTGNESWLLHLGGNGPGNLEFHRRTAPGAWSPVMALTTGERQVEIYGQDALGMIGFEPFLSFYDSRDNSYARARIQSAGGNLIFRPDGGHVYSIATDLWLGHPTRRGAPGRALVDAGVVNGSSELHLNFASDWAKTVIGGNNVSVCTLTIRGGCDLAEPFQMSTQEIPKGAVVVIDDENAGKLKLSDRAYDHRVAGIVSGANGIEPGISLYQQGVIEGGQNVALSGRVYVQVDASTGAIKPGDLLTTSATPGHAMKVADHSRSQGAILGKAMTALKDGQGMVLVLVTLQ